MCNFGSIASCGMPSWSLKIRALSFIHNEVTGGQKVPWVASRKIWSVSALAPLVNTNCNTYVVATVNLEIDNHVRSQIIYKLVSCFPPTLIIQKEELRNEYIVVRYVPSNWIKMLNTHMRYFRFRIYRKRDNQQPLIISLQYKF